MTKSVQSSLKYPSSTYGWSMVGLLTLAYIFSMLDRYILGYLIRPIKEDLNFTDLEVGLLTGPAFTILYATTAIPIGLWVDRRSRTKIIAIGITVWSVATVMTGFARTFTSMFLARMLVGIGEAVLSPAAFSIIGDSFAPEKRAKPIAFYSAALVLASALTGFIIAFLLGFAKDTVFTFPGIGAVPSWQFIFICVGAPGLIVALIFFVIKEAPRTEHPEMFERTYGAADWNRKNYAARNGMAILCIGLLTYFVAGAQCLGPLMSSGWAAFIGVNVLGAVGIGMVSCTGVTALLQIVPGHVRGFTVALYYMAISFIGGLTSPLLVGFMSSNIFGEANLNIAMSVLPLIYGIPAILLLPWTVRLYRRELVLNGAG